MHSPLNLLLATATVLWAPAVWAQQDILYDTAHNATSLLGTWSSGSGAVVTGAGFANPVNFSFTYPTTTGISYSFTTDVLSDGSAGYFEEALYRFTGNGSQPTCIVGVVQWQHGTYQTLANGSMILNPFASDGRQQVQDMCAAQSNIIRQFNQTTLFQSWRIFSDPQRGPKLQIYQFDGSPLAPMFQLAQTPNMLPTTTLTANVTDGQTSSSLSGAPRRQDLGVGAMMTAVGLASFVGLLTCL
ncbi:Reversal of tor2 lethality [Tulasnella sp. JGI-2019a]|nr:Reversal of tor2 lethality [Tulasnella sp. JGI-2019a]KAG9008807.1 Reversal of tor2 lethality [Tulasnella sp. JGI-2019a]KAG9034023.1 Reversal of tor2 lethality [Tulasnella sp. JGI-2019a]